MDIRCWRIVGFVFAGWFICCSISCRPTRSLPTSSEPFPPDTSVEGAEPLPESPTTIRIDPNRRLRAVPPGVVGWGAMWKRKMLWPPPPATLNDRTHAEYIKRLAEANAPLIRQSDTRHLSWPWGVSFSTWGVNWENSAMRWSERVPDRARLALLNRGSGWNEKTVVGVGDLLTLASHWELEAVTVSVPLTVLDGTKKRWGPDWVHHAFSEETIEKISDHAKRLVEYMKEHPAWPKLQRVYLAAGCEWRHYTLRTPSRAVLTYAELIKRIRSKIPDKKVFIVACASDSADIPGIKRDQANGWNRYLYEQLVNTQGVVLDLHRYRGMIGLQRGSRATTPLNRRNVDLLLKTGVTQRDFLQVAPKQWGKRGPAMPSVLLENAIHGLLADHAQHSEHQHPWPAVMAHADLVREALASGTECFLGWTWFPEDLPPEWPHGAIRDGELALHAQAQAFLSEYHRGHVVDSGPLSSAPVRGNATQTADGTIFAYGGNFSRRTRTLQFAIQGAPLAYGQVELFFESGKRQFDYDGKTPITLEPMSLWRIRFARSGNSP